MSRSTVHTLAQLRSLPVGTTMSLGDLVPVVKVEPAIYATPSDVGSGWAYYAEEELTGEAQGDLSAAWLGRLVISEVPSRA